MSGAACPTVLKTQPVTRCTRTSIAASCQQWKIHSSAKPAVCDYLPSASLWGNISRLPVIVAFGFTFGSFSRHVYPKRPTFMHTFTHTDGGVNHARRQPARREQAGLRCLAQGRLDTRQREARGRTSNLPVTSQPLLT